MKRWAAALMVVLPLMGAGGTAHAGFVDFGVIPGGGLNPSLSYNGSGGPLVGSGLFVSSVLGEGTTANDGINLPASATLSFTTGALISTTSNTWVFGPGGSLTIIGTAGSVVTSSATLYSGSFEGDTTVISVGGGFKVIGATVTGNLNQALALFFDQSYPDTFNGGFSLLFNGSTADAPPGGFTDTGLNSGNVAVAGLPEPASWALLCLGVGSCLLGRKYLRAG